MREGNDVRLYGVHLDLPVEVPATFHRSPPPPTRPVLPVTETSVPVVEAPIWSSDDDQRILIERRAGSVVVALGRDRFEIDEGGIRADCDDLATAFDVNHNVLAALLLPQLAVAAFHANVVDLDRRRVAVVGPSGSGKTTLGGQLVDRGGRLVSDDLLALDGDGLAHDGPPFRRLLDRRPGATLDPGGKFRLPCPSGGRPPAPVDLYVVLDDRATEPTTVVGVAALDALLAHPYSPVAADRHEPLVRLTNLEASLGRAAVLVLPPRWRHPAGMADEVERHLTGRDVGDGQGATPTPPRA